jgi:hypothetical protein
VGGRSDGFCRHGFGTHRARGLVPLGPALESGCFTAGNIFVDAKDGVERRRTELALVGHDVARLLQDPPTTSRQHVQMWVARAARERQIRQPALLMASRAGRIAPILASV